jgi:hypothetical protein
MKAPLTGNSITERVVFTGLYIPEPAWETDAEGAEGSPGPQGDEVPGGARLET